MTYKRFEKMREGMAATEETSWPVRYPTKPEAIQDGFGEEDL